MNFHIPFLTRHDPEKAELRDRLIMAETKVILLTDLVEHPRSAPRVLREPRRDAQRVKDAKAAMTAKLRTELGLNEDAA